jgi:membrane-associated phospholipid phosphatase
VALAVLYLLTVRTSFGQHLDNDALLGRSLNPRVQHATQRLLHSVDVTSLAVIGGAIVLVALARARIWLAAAAATLIGGAVLTTETLQRVLPRPVLSHPARLAVASYPSGHTTVAASLALALVLVVAPRWRGTAALAGTAYAAAVGVGTVTAAWHRPSDAIGAFLVAVFWAVVVSAVLIDERGPGSPAGRRAARKSGRLSADVLAVAAVLLAVGGFAVAGMLAALRDRQLETVHIGAAYAASVGAIVAVAAALVAAFLVCLRGVVLDTPLRRRQREPRPTSTAAR